MRRLLALCALATLALGQPPPARWICVHGEYRNQAGYGFRLTLPPGLTGHRAPPPAPSHGLTVHLGSAANHISITGIYNAAEYASPRAALQPLVALRPAAAPGGLEILYQITLDTATPQDTAVYQSIRASFRLEPIPGTHVR